MRKPSPTFNGKRIPAFLAFIPFGVILIWVFEAVMPLSWISLATALSSISLAAIITNVAARDAFWAFLGIWAYISVGISVYTIIVNKRSRIGNDQSPTKFSFSNLFKTCSTAVFSDYKVSFLSKIPFILQVILGGTILYKINGADWVMHALAGFGIAALAMKAYIAGIGKYGYERIASYFRIRRFNSYKIERRYAVLEFAIFSVIVCSIPWEMFEQIIYRVSTDNVFRVGAEPFWNYSGDFLSAIFGGILSWYLLYKKFEWV
jgi:hypothetical protein